MLRLSKPRDHLENSTRKISTSSQRSRSSSSFWKGAFVLSNRCNLAPSSQNPQRRRNRTPNLNLLCALTLLSSNSGCSFCSAAHYNASCSEFASKSINERQNFVAWKNLCFNCLGSHRFSECLSVNDADEVKASITRYSIVKLHPPPSRPSLRLSARRTPRTHRCIVRRHQERLP